MSTEAQQSFDNQGPTAATRGGNTGKTVPTISSAASFLRMNSKYVVPTDGRLSEAQIEILLNRMIADIPELNDLGTADHADLLTQLVTLIVCIGGEDRRYDKGTPVKILVGSKVREFDTAQFKSVVDNLRFTVRSIARSRPNIVNKVLCDPEVKEYFASTYGEFTRPEHIRADLAVKRTVVKYDQVAWDKNRKETLAAQSSGSLAEG